MNLKTKPLWLLTLTVSISSMLLCAGITMPVLPARKKTIKNLPKASAGQLMAKSPIVAPPHTRTNYLVWDSGNTNALTNPTDNYGFRVYSATNPVGPWLLYATVSSHSNHIVLLIDNTNKVEFFRVAAIIQ